ncbi:hypothetical protein D3C75_957560 [compost metagenome]
MQNLQTGLYVEIEGITVHYGRVLNVLLPAGWDEMVYFVHTGSYDGISKHNAAVEKVVRLFEEQSYDHGSEWRETKRELIDSDESSYVSLISFRIRDIY